MIHIRERYKIDLEETPNDPTFRPQLLLNKSYALQPSIKIPESGSLHLRLGPSLMWYSDSAWFVI